jgi:hypothetical protein
MPCRTLKGFNLISALMKTYYAMFYVVFATQPFVRYAVLFEFQRQPYFSFNATLWGFQPLTLWQKYCTFVRFLMQHQTLGGVLPSRLALQPSTHQAYISMSDARGFTPISGKGD